ncbi:hypothetical protein BMF94_2843 [Rhodotorula taiwanensis]|uniref:GRF-type domain-containing protein n=1 Tax=Rhodotorula taiwanensis TaxID=741276 RepID=A0A2S5BBC6_9BASI|nr:hypothetical protein BMF94_2843 [Rhodotorula taiwanensis]
MPRSLTGRSPTQRQNKYEKSGCFGPGGVIYCYCNTNPRIETRLRTCQTNKSGNRGRKFFSCTNEDEYCSFFLWVDQLENYRYPYGHGGGYVAGEYGDPECCGFEDDEDAFGHADTFGDWTPGSDILARQPYVNLNKKTLYGRSPWRRKRERELDDERDCCGGDDDDYEAYAPSSSWQSRTPSPKKKQKVVTPRPSRTAARASPSPTPAAAAERDSDDKIALMQTQLEKLRREVSALKSQGSPKKKEKSTPSKTKVKKEIILEDD